MIQEQTEQTLLEILTSNDIGNIRLGVALTNQLPNDRRRYIMMHLSSAGWILFKNGTGIWKCCYSVFDTQTFIHLRSNVRNDEYFSKLKINRYIH